ncbi:MAG: ABC transporter substrate-binding protein [Ktedonobacterales bacterium]
MQCPRCGYLNDDTAKTCAGCGLPLPPYASEPTSRPHQPYTGFETSQTVDGIWREDETSQGDTAQDIGRDGPPSWLMRALRESDQRGQFEARETMPPQPHSPPSGFAAPPTFQRDVSPDSGISRQPSFPAYGGDLPVPHSAGGSPAPFSAGGGHNSFELMTPAPSQMGTSLEPLSVAAPSGQLVPGASLKGGRYRVLQPFYSGPIQPPRNEPPLMIASDAELPAGRVLIQEVLLNALRPEDGENARRLIAQRLLSLRSHPAMPRLIDHFGQQWRQFLVFEFPSGDLLADRLQRAHGPLPEAAAVRVALQVTEVLEIFEQQSPAFIHGNLSPASLILRPSGQVVVIGCSPHLLLYPDGTVDNPPAGGISGYVAPEQLRGHATTRSDIFGLCAILLHAVTGIAPSPRANAPHPPARHQNPGVSLELEEILGQGLRPSWTQRYQTAADLRNALERLVSGQVTHVPEELRDQDRRGTGLVAVRDAKGRLVLPHQRRLQSPLFLFGIILSLIVLIAGAVLFAASPHRSTSIALPTPNDQAQMVQQQNIGLSGGEFTFDSELPDSSLKTQGARYLASGEVAQAHTSFLNAMSADPSDAEAAIYAEDLEVSLDQAPFITIVVGTAFDPTASPVDVAASRSELEGIYLAQHHINSENLLPDGIKVRVLVLNSGLTANGASTAANVLVQQIDKGNPEHIVGIIGWPETTQTERAHSKLLSSGLPLITPTGSDDSMTNIGASLFRMVPLDSEQAQDMADVAVNQMGATSVAVLFDPKDQLSYSMANSFITRLTSDELSTSISEHSITYTSDVKTNFAAMAMQAVVHDQANLIYLSTGEQGGDTDSIDLARAVVAASHDAGVQTPPILVDSRAYTPGLLGLGDSSAASVALAEATPAVYSDLYVETLANLQEWAALNLSASEANAFGSEFSTQYGTNVSPDELQGPNSTVILTYDALDLLAAASSSAIGGTSGAIVYPTITKMHQALLDFSTIHPFIGVSGAISYDQVGNVNGDLPSTDVGHGRAFGILKFDPFPSPLADGQLASAQIAFVAGGVASFCSGPTTCSMSSV